MMGNLHLIGRLLRGIGPNATRRQVRDLLLDLECRGTSQAAAQAYAYYRRFLRLVCSYAPYAQGGAPEVDYDLVVDLVAVQRERGDGVLALVDRYPDWRRAVDILRDASPGEEPAAPLPKLLLYQGDRLRLAAAFGAQPGTHAIEDVQPGPYTLVLDDGRVLWQQALSDTEVSWRLAFPDRSLELVAHAAQVLHRVPHRTWRLLDGLVEIRLFPGVETASLELWAGSIGGADSDDLS